MTLHTPPSCSSVGLVSLPRTRNGDATPSRQRLRHRSNESRSLMHLAVGSEISTKVARPHRVSYITIRTNINETKGRSDSAPDTDATQAADLIDMRGAHVSAYFARHCRYVGIWFL